VAALGCHHKHATPPAPAVTEVRVIYKGQALPGAPKLDVPALTRAARTAIAASSGLLLREDGGGAAHADPRATTYALRVTLEIGAAEDRETKRGNLRALVHAELEPIGAPPGALSFEQSALAEHPFVVGQPGEPDWQGNAEHAVRDCVAGVGARVKLAAGDAKAIVAALDGADDDLRQEAVRLAADRRDRAAVPSLIRQLKSDDGATRDRAIGALAAIGDRRAVRPLTEVAKFNDLMDLPKVLDALATIGGPEARAYLEFVASGHDNAQMRELAKQAIGHLDRRAAEARADKPTAGR
jgi:hypothetical protein